MPCVDCLQNCGNRATSDQCVEYTGDDIEFLGICSGDQISKLEAAIVTALQSALDGTGVSIGTINLNTCPWLANQFVGQSPTLANFLQLFANANCSLYAMIQQINQNTGGSTSFTTSCLGTLPLNPTPNQVLAALTADYCNVVKPQLAAIPTTYVQKSDLSNQVQQILTTLGLLGGNTTSTAYNQYIPIYGIIPYFGPLSNFDNTGAGLASAGLSGLYLCNGLNNTPDFRGRNLIGAINSVPGGSLNSAVDPSKAYNPNTNFSVGDVAGEFYHTLITAEMPSHNHTISDPGHSHTISQYVDAHSSVGGPQVLSPQNQNHGSATSSTNSAPTGIGINSTGGGSFHNNIQPSVAVLWIMRLK